MIKADRKGRLELKRLRVFVAVAEELHFGRAAERLHLVQSAVSQQLKLLEQELGTLLLERTRRQVTLTDAGRLFLPEARCVLWRADAAARVARAAGSGNAGRLELGFVDNALWSGMPASVRLFRQRFPAVELGLQQLDRSEQIAALRGGGIDLGLLPAPPSMLEFDSFPFVDGRLLLALPRGHVLANRRSVPIGLLAEEPFVLFPASMGTHLHEIVRETCASVGFVPRVVQEARQLHILLALVGSGLGVTLAPRWASSVPIPDVLYRELKEPVPTYRLNWIWRRDAVNRAVPRFLEVVRGGHGR